MKRFFPFVLLLFASFRIFGQEGNVHFVRADITKGLSNNQVNSIYRDKSGYVWIGTMSGLNRYDGHAFKIFRNIAGDTNSINDNYIHRIFPFPGDRLMIVTRNGANIYDPLTEQFRANDGEFLKSLGLPADGLNKIVVDSKDNYWFIYNNGSLWRYAQDKKVDDYTTSATLPRGKISDVTELPGGLVWIVYSDGRLLQFNWIKNRIVLISDALKQQVRGNNIQYVLFAAANGNLWVHKNNEAAGAFCLSAGKNGKLSIKHYAKESAALPLNSNVIFGITEDRKGNTWIATDHGGINVVNSETGKISYMLNNVEDPRSISQNSTVVIYRDQEDIIWLGTYKQGLNYYNGNLARFPLYKHLANTAGSLNYDDVNSFAEDAKGNIWIGTNGGGLVYFDRQKNSFRQYLAGAGSISNNVIVSLCIDHQQNLWIGSYFGGLDKFDGKHFTNYRNNISDTNSLADDRVWEIFEDSKKNLWIGTLSAGLDRFDRNRNIFYHYKYGRPNSIGSLYVSAILEDKKGSIWFGTANGISVLHPNGVFDYYQSNRDSANTLSNNNIICLLQDKRGLLWIGTREGLNVMDPVTKAVRSFYMEDGLPDNTILNILEDENGRLWLSSPGGLAKIELQWSDNNLQHIKLLVTNYDELNNLQATEFNENAGLKTNRGELIFGGPFGFNIFKPADIHATTNKPQLVFTGLEIFNKPVKVGEKINDKVLLPKAISTLGSITLHYNQNVFSIGFAALDFAHTGKNKYAYKLDGFNKDWLFTDGSLRKATYTNLDPGNYTFHVKSVNNDGTLSAKEAVINIRILPPLWKTPLAFIGYFFILVLALWFARRLVLQRAKMRFAIERERQEANRMHELDLMKIRFITNVSHEFRTPLSLIIAPIEKLLGTTKEPFNKSQYHLIHRNARRLLNLVNQLLDFRKMEVQEFTFNTTENDMVSFVKEISYSFADIAEKKHIQFKFTSSVKKQLLQFDADKMEKILLNLLSNAYKFTPQGGSVGVDINLGETGIGSLVPNSFIELKVWDTGIGMEQAHTEKIFERFFQHNTPGEILNQGSGIGLAIVKEFVRLHNGSIKVESELNKGSCFIIKLPVINSFEQTVSPREHVSFNIPAIVNASAVSSPKLKGKRATILIVEDNEDFRFYLKDNLGLHYHIIEAGNGREGWQMVQQFHPDLIVSDIMMPVMDGLELAKKIKHDPRTATMPVILLTARSNEEQQLEGLDTGANDYITKPFSFELLLSRIKNLLEQQRSNKKSIKQITVSTTDVTLESGDEKFIQQALSVVEKNMSDITFSVEDLSRALLLSRVGLYKKMLALTGKTPIEFIRDIRMKRATQLLVNSKMNVAEIAYEVGFNDPKYFAKAFKKQFGVLPSSYIKSGENGSIQTDKSSIN
jgi:signal transduction histidine kinase/ligand-binding sensor domain-containing protein/DNA-binding response OmpR family regulator